MEGSLGVKAQKFKASPTITNKTQLRADVRAVLARKAHSQLRVRNAQLSTPSAAGTSALSHRGRGPA